MRLMRFYQTSLLSLILSLILASHFAPGQAQADTRVDRIVAQVNREVITLSELEARLKNLTQAQKTALGASGDPRRPVLELMIEQELVSQAAKRQGIMVSNQEVTEAIRSIEAENHLNEAQFLASLKSSGTSLEAFKSDLKLEILKNKVLGIAVMNKIVITEKEVTDFLNGNGPPAVADTFIPGQEGSPDHYGVRMIFLASNPKDSAKVIARAKKIKSEIEGGLSFAEAAGRYSEGPGRDQGGDTGSNLTLGELQPQLRAVAKQLSPGQVSEPLDGGQAVLLLTVVPTDRPKSAAPPTKKNKNDQYSDEQKALARRQLEQIKMRQKYEEWISSIKRQATIKINL